jgi:hypothetical protein
MKQTNQQHIPNNTKLVNKSKIKELADEYDLRVSDDAIERAADRFYHILIMAIKRSKGNDRKTLMERDI